MKEGRASLFIVLLRLAGGVTAPLQFHVRIQGSEVNVAAGRSAFHSQSLFTCLQAGAFRHKHIRKPLPPCLTKPPQHWKWILHTEGCHHRKGCSQLQNMAAPTSPCSCVCIYLGFIPATHFCEHWTILQRTIVSFCLNYPVENNRNILLRHINAAGCSNAWIL